MWVGWLSRFQIVILLSALRLRVAIREPSELIRILYASSKAGSMLQLVTPSRAGGLATIALRKNGALGSMLSFSFRCSSSAPSVGSSASVGAGLMGVGATAPSVVLSPTIEFGLGFNSTRTMFCSPLRMVMTSDESVYWPDVSVI